MERKGGGVVGLGHGDCSARLSSERLLLALADPVGHGDCEAEALRGKQGPQDATDTGSSIPAALPPRMPCLSSLCCLDGCLGLWNGAFREARDGWQPVKQRTSPPGVRTAAAQMTEHPPPPPPPAPPLLQACVPASPTASSAAAVTGGTDAACTSQSRVGQWCCEEETSCCASSGLPSSTGALRAKQMAKHIPQIVEKLYVAFGFGIAWLAVVCGIW